MSRVVERTVPNRPRKHTAVCSAQESDPKINNWGNAACIVPDIETDLSWQLTEEFEFWKVHFADEQLAVLHDIFS